MFCSIKTSAKHLNDIPQKRVAEYLNMKKENYNRLESDKWKPNNINDLKKKIINMFILECLNMPTDRKTLGMSQKRCAKDLGVDQGNFCTYERSGREIKGLKEVLETEYQRRQTIKERLLEMLTKI